MLHPSLGVALERGVGFGRRKQQEERGPWVALLDELDGHPNEVLGLVALDGDRVSLIGEVDGPVVHVLVSPARTAHVVAHPAIEPSLRWQAVCAAVPLADQCRAIARPLQQLRQQHFIFQPITVELRCFG